MARLWQAKGCKIRFLGKCRRFLNIDLISKILGADFLQGLACYISRVRIRYGVDNYSLEALASRAKIVGMLWCAPSVELLCGFGPLPHAPKGHGRVPVQFSKMSVATSLYGLQQNRLIN